MLVYGNRVSSMDRWTEHLLVILMLLSGTLHVLSQEEKRRHRHERGVIFEVSNGTGRDLPVFDPVVKVVKFAGSNVPLGPKVDEFGNPLCIKNPEDTFCESVDAYPDSEIRRAIQYSKDEFKDLFGTQLIKPRTMKDDSEETVCPQQSRYFYPKAAVNENDQWAFVVNDVDYVQAVVSELCENEDKPCSYVDGALPHGMSSHCRQKYAYKRLLALHPNQKKTYTDAFKFPSCCVCYITRSFLISRTRMMKVDDNKKPGQ